MSDRGTSEGDLGDRAPQAEPAPPHPAQSQDSAAPRDTALAEVGVLGQREGVQPALPLNSAAATAYPGPRISGLANWTPMAAPSLFAYAPTQPKSPGCPFLAGVAPGVTAQRLPGCGPLPSLALDDSASLQNRAIELLIQHLPLLTELPNISRKLEDLLSLQEQLLQITKVPCRAGCAGPAPPAPPAPPTGDAVPNKGAARLAANPEVALPQENLEAAVAAERRPGAAAPNAAGERETASVSAAARNAAAEQGPGAAPNTATKQGPAAAPGAAVAPETTAAAPVPVRSGLAETASHKEAAVQTAAQPIAVCAAFLALANLAKVPLSIHLCSLPASQSCLCLMTHHWEVKQMRFWPQGVKLP
ncbi:nematocyst expressed protein 3-like [Aphelocoma coerulescens]|uniref:nematocyst expressed protein 3-like n=1 Tax=Aphelocoma coerulescens TaxID=39617 RepID=UPI0036050F3B